ncbi:Phage tail protein (Tail_P2_I) [Syntrophus gentianae]|uniref:Phage tail protein (Tail_P2_I) n=1 Tax=Syntrophus gentianae TaxID=43775 RepID=A0A1H7V9N1_9BACT|nr:phage tail protein [Syntrophus gentianae]SEM05973.1 Phage tail protein (Tail_P2_I) [Syntrophus gentianae]
MATDKLTTVTGKQLYRILPEVYRTRDSEETGGQEDLARFLDACGELLDRIRATLDQRLADSFPDNPPAGLTCQPWLIPYFAQLLDVRLVSPDEKGRRDEVANAVAWRQRKGTLTVIEQIAEAVGQMEAEVREGWRRTAVSPRIGMPRLPAGALGEEAAFDDFQQHPLWAARHPDLPTATVDFRYPTRAMELSVAAGEFPSNPAAKLTKFAGTSVWWRQVNPHGAPCFPGSFDDVSRRTVDLRTPDWQQGHIHPKRVILHAPPPLGFFSPGLFPVHKGGDMILDGEEEHRLEDLIIDGTLTVKAGTLRLRRCAIRALDVSIPAAALDDPVVKAEECLFEKMAVPGLVRLEYCTVLGNCEAGRLQASDCLFAGKLKLSPGLEKYPHCIRFSRIPPGVLTTLLTHRNTTERPVFYTFEFDEGGEVVRRTARFGESGCAVLHPATPETIRFGAEDGGEMGAHHGWRYSLLLSAVLDKLKEFLPVGMEAVIVPDLRLHRLPISPCDTD